MKQVRCEMTGTLLELKVKVGDAVKVGQEIAVIESMKMEVPVQAPVAGKVEKIVKAAGEFLNEGDVFLELS